MANSVSTMPEAAKQDARSTGQSLVEQKHIVANNGPLTIPDASANSDATASRGRAITDKPRER